MAQGCDGFPFDKGQPEFVASCLLGDGSEEKNL